MSDTYYNELWLITRNDLDKLIQLDRKLQQQPKTADQGEGLNLLLPIYLRYRNLAKRLIVCHDQMVQTQKRDLIKRVLDCTVGRMLEYKQEIVNTNYNDYQWPDDFMYQFKYTPDDVENCVSAVGKDVVQQRKERIQKLIEDALTISAEIIESEEPSADVDMESMESRESSPKLRRRRVREEPSETKQPAILQETPEEIAAREAREAAEQAIHNSMLLIQCHERARMGRRTGAEVQRMYNYNKKLESGEIVPKKLHREVYMNAAKTIQRAWRRYKAKKRMKKRIEIKEELLGMTIPSWKSNEILDKDREDFQRKLTLMPRFADRIVKATENERTRLFKIRGPGLVEDITDEIREWFIVWYNDVGHFDVYPAANLGGSVLIATGETLTPKQFLAQKSAKEKKSAAAKAKPKKKKTPWMPETTAYTLLDEANRDFVKDWSFRDDSNDRNEKVYHDLIKDKLCYELQLEMRQITDELMRLELKALNRALKKDYAADKRKLDIPKEKRRKKKKKKDPLDDMSTEDMFKELVRASIIRSYPETSINDWIGDLSYQNYEAAREYRDYKHRMGEIKQVIMEYCVLPLGTREIHEIAPLIRSVCICGFPRHGKSFLVNAICSEIGAVMFDMTPTVLIDKYTGKRNERKLIDMISRIARVYAPSVIFIDNGEKPWLKKVPPQERYHKPKRFAKYYPKLVKSIKRGDQMLFLTTSSEPYKATRPFVRIHDKFIMIPLTDYNTLYMFYKDLLMKYHGIDRNIDVSCLARMSVGIPLEFISNAIENVLNLRRRITLRFKPLMVSEIIEEVLKYEPPKPKIMSQFAKFENRTPLARRRTRLLAAEKAEHERLQKEKEASK
ncbi:PREDICTED: IQ and AAA domain-containing protein 1-like [Habropoda laboriosa]|uniref:IQ and AAA domain-containing protein 1-like n=1 Tax=Habropoda laboriosa TaxID=597456 RepID=UPI00083DB3C6|nr:PREDICTED: IQ and AAA domain-containing protein 1-like [Habropoda laboriosa]